MAVLTINGKEYEGKCDFKFNRVAKEKYNEADESGNKTGAFLSIYMGLMSKDNDKLLAFWDSALSHYKKDKPSVDDIEEALFERIEEEGAEVLFKEPFGMLEESGFYAPQRKEFWNGLEKLKESGKTAEEKKNNAQMFEVMSEARQSLKN